MGEIAESKPANDDVEVPSAERNLMCKLAVLYFFVYQGFCVGIYSSQVSIFRDNLDISDFVLGIITSFVALGYICAAPVSAGLCRSFGSMWIALFGSQFLSQVWPSVRFRLVRGALEWHGRSVAVTGYHVSPELDEKPL